MKAWSVHRGFDIAIIKGYTDGLKSYRFVLKRVKLVGKISVLEDRIKVNDKTVILHRNQVHENLNLINVCEIG